MQYRRDIDGLRALAVLPVILFHAGFEVFKGGFIGVDVFFVISGYLITGLILDEKQQGRFSLLRFYQRRARRILPALLTVLLLCIPCAWLWMPPSQHLLFSENLIAIIAFVSNVFLWRSSGYFAPSAHENPLLHTWSLSVEEQYYFVFPLMLLALWRLGRRWLGLAITLMLLGSLALADYASYRAPGGTFYLIPSRAWELLAGSLLALIVSRRPLPENTALSSLGLGMILLSYGLFDDGDRWPALPALLPILGSVLTVGFTGPTTLTYRLLASRPLVFIGLISYSAYLWHQPIFAFARLQAAAPVSPVVMGGLAVASLLVAWLSWKVIETPFRRQTIPLPGWGQLALALGCSAILVATGFIGYQANGFPDRFSIPDSVYESMKRPAREAVCFGFADTATVEPWKCALGVPGDKTDFFVLGDSHALSLLDAFDSIARAENLSGEFTAISGCTPLLGIHALRPDQGEHNCHDLNERTFQYIKARQIKTLYLVARWTGSTDNVFAGGTSYIATSPDGSKSLETSRAAFQSGLAETIRRYHEIGTRLVVIRQIPHQPGNPTDIYLRLPRNGDQQAYLTAASVTAETHAATQSFVDNLFRSASQQATDGLRYEDLSSSLCSDHCLIGTPTESYYYDDHHLGAAGSKRVTPALRAIVLQTLVR